MAPYSAGIVVVVIAVRARRHFQLHYVVRALLLTSGAETHLLLLLGV